MNLLPVIGVGGLRIVQSNFNKKASRYTETTIQKLRFGGFFEAAAALFSLVYLFFVGFTGNVSATLLCALITGVGFLIELLTALAAMRHAPLPLCTLCALGGGIVVPSIVSIFWFDEPMSWIKWIGVLLFFVAAGLLTPSEKKNDTFRFSKAIPVLVVNFLINGVLSTLGKFYAVRIEGGNAAMYALFSYAIAAMSFGIVALFVHRKSHSQQTVLPKKIYWFGTVLGAVCATIVFSTTVLARHIPVVVLNTIPNAICITGSIFIGRLLFKESITLLNMIGTVLSIISTTMIILNV